MITAEEAAHEVSFVLAFCRHAKLDLRRFADVGAGTGWWTKEFKRQYRKRCEIETFDSSAVAVKNYGHKLTTADKFGGRPYDLIVCRDVLRYMDNATAERAIDRLGAKSRGVLYLHVITRDDEIDQSASDMSGHFRSTRWYTQRLAGAGFVNVGMGLFVSRKFRDFNPFAIEIP